MPDKIWGAVLMSFSPATAAKLTALLSTRRPSFAGRYLDLDPSGPMRWQRRPARCRKVWIRAVWLPLPSTGTVIWRTTEEDQMEGLRARTHGGLH
jgi:hypothetical protein